ncbi:MAG: hypothetical protein HeimC3_18500 [Candidatus Heimdallarchaeota archaeon LC_3]|nr:MAG: hypothetical protein HeimC3_18500 [Candidatus Heimdallarchaeota archaeon LC_3]
MKLEYQIIMQKSGIPIYSRCFGGFCWNLMTDEILLSGFLSALSTMPTMFGGDDLSLKNVEMGSTKLFFNHTTPSSHIICLGIAISSTNEPDANQEVQNLFEKISIFLEVNHAETDFTVFSKEERINFHEEIKIEVIEPSLIVFEDKDFCRTHGRRDSCPIDTEKVTIVSENHPLPIWEGLKKSYTNKTRIQKFIFFISKPILKISTTYLVRKHKKRYIKLRREKEHE